MPKVHKVLLIPGLLFVTFCKEAEFEGGQGKAPAPQATSSAAPSADAQPPSDCLKGDKATINWTGPAKECIIDQRRTFNFDAQKCSQMREAPFTCDWENVVRELTKRNLLTKELEQSSTNGGKLVSCGMSQDANRIVVQWIRSTAGATVDCSDPSSVQVTTGCYRRLTAEDPAPPTTPEEKQKAVYECIENL